MIYSEKVVKYYSSPIILLDNISKHLVHIFTYPGYGTHRTLTVSRFLSTRSRISGRSSRRQLYPLKHAAFQERMWKQIQISVSEAGVQQGGDL